MELEYTVQEQMNEISIHLHGWLTTTSVLSLYQIYN